MRWRWLLAGCALTGAGIVRASDTITWLLPDSAPVALPVDGKPGKGITDQMVIYLAANWPGIEHRFRFANNKRIWTMLATDEHVCYAAAIVTAERRAGAYFSLTNLATPLQLIVRDDELSRLPLNAAGEVSLPRLMASATLRGLALEKRSYGERIDQLIGQRPAGSALSMVPPNSYGGNLLKMIASGQSDYTLEYDFVLSYQASLNPALSALRAVPIEGNSALLPVGIACPRTAWGRAAIETIDRIVGTRAGAQAMRKAADNWLSPGARAHYGKEIDAFTAQRARPATPADF